ncbi:MAG: hypothetical protein LKE40_14735 [Spirochaetia bacterium]|jgi:hypothetical protein|nr:hypothetical protein [Spirochaetia bacterium]
MVQQDKLGILPPYVPQPFKERNFPVFPSHLKDWERQSMIPLEKEIKLATTDEPTVQLADNILCDTENKIPNYNS